MSSPKIITAAGQSKYNLLDYDGVNAGYRTDILDAINQRMEDALKRAFAYVTAGADAIMIHSRKKSPDEIFQFVDEFRQKDTTTPIVVVPTSFNTVTEDEFKAHGVNIVIYANQLTRTGFPAMQKAAQCILEHHRAKECDDLCMPIKDIINLIPEE